MWPSISSTGTTASTFTRLSRNLEQRSRLSRHQLTKNCMPMTPPRVSRAHLHLLLAPNANLLDKAKINNPADLNNAVAEAAAPPMEVTLVVRMDEANNNRMRALNRLNRGTKAKSMALSEVWPRDTLNKIARPLPNHNKLGSESPFEYPVTYHHASVPSFITLITTSTHFELETVSNYNVYIGTPPSFYILLTRFLLSFDFTGNVRKADRVDVYYGVRSQKWFWRLERMIPIVLGAG